MKLKVLYITNLPVPYRVDFCSELGKICELTVLFEGKRFYQQDFNWKDDSSLSYKAIYLSDILNSQNIKWEIFSYLKDLSFDRIIFGNYDTRSQSLGILFLKMQKRKYYFQTDGGMISYGENIARKWIKKTLISGALGYLSPSHETDIYLKYYGANQNRIYRYPFTSINEYDVLDAPLSFEKKNILRTKLNIPEEKVILSVGQFIYRKGFDVLLKVMRNFPNTIGVYFIGGKPSEEYLSLIKTFNLTNVHFVGFKTKEELAEYYKLADIFVLPTREDIWGLVINEAMSFGLPIVTTKKCVAGLELISDKNCIVDVDDENQLYSSIKLILDDPDFREQLAYSNIKKIRNYTIQEMAKTIFSTIKHV